MSSNNNKNDKKTMLSSSMSTGMQMGLFAVMLGASAGFTLYTRKTSSMLKQMDKVKKYRRFPTKYGPMTKAEWEKVKPIKDGGFY